MTQADFTVSNQAFPATRAEINTSLQALATNSAGNSAPSTTFPSQWFFDSDGDTLFIRNKDNDAFVSVLTIGATSDDVQSLFANVIAEGTSATGVTVDGLLIKDGNIGAAGTVTSIGGVNVLLETNSIFIGDDVSGTTDTAANSVAVGVDALDAVTTGDANVAVGKSSLSAVNTGSDNIAIGNQAGASITEGHSNITIGSNAGDGFDTETNNLGIGVGSLGDASLAGGEFNVAIGNYSLDALTSADKCVAIGYDAGTEITTGGANSLVGFEAGKGITTGTNNTLFGFNAGDGFDTEGHNLGIGRDALGGSIAGGEFNVAVGSFGLSALTSADDCTTVGYNAGSTISSGARNTFIGSDAGNTVSSGVDNTIVGENAQTGHTGADQQTIIGRGASGSSTQHQIVIGYNTASTGNGYVTLGTGSSTNRIYNLYTTNATWTHASDERIKKDITTNTDCGLDFINELRTVKYRKKNHSEVDPSMASYDAEDTEPKDDIIYGLIAQEVKAAMDKHNITDFAGWNKLDKEVSPDEIQGISEQMFVFPLVKAVQELSEEINKLKGV